MIRKVFPDKDKVKIISIPDIDSINYGRDVVYDIREIRLDKEVENISSTKLRRL